MPRPLTLSILSRAMARTRRSVAAEAERRDCADLLKNHQWRPRALVRYDLDGERADDAVEWTTRSTPTFLPMTDGHEMERTERYSGADVFWGLIEIPKGNTGAPLDRRG